jgi:hypothetical protein
MMATDTRFLELYREYAKAIQAFENATKDRRRVRASIAARRRAPPAPRRPVGSPAGYRIPAPPPGPAPRPAPKKERQVYLGKILGWAKIAYTSWPLNDAPDASAFFDSDALYDETSLRLYWNSKEHYRKCKKAFFEYARQTTNDVRRERIREHLEKAKAEATHLANLQYLGVEDVDETGLEAVQAEVEAACKESWAIYQRMPNPKSDAAKLELINAQVDAQLTGADETPIGQTIQAEITRLINSGGLSMVKR